MVCQGEQEKGGGCHHDNNRVAKGNGTTSGKGKECACYESGACMSSAVSVRACARVVEGGGGRLNIMVCPLRGNYAESCVECGRGGLLWDVCPLCVFVRMLAKRCL